MSLLVLSLSIHLLSQSQAAIALPLNSSDILNDNVSPNQTVTHWVQEPVTRGTWGILSSCLFTLTLCVYTAIHLNVPKSRESFPARILRKLKWVLVAIFAPEVVLYSAYVQWSSARSLVQEINAIAKENGHIRGVAPGKSGVAEDLKVNEGTNSRSSVAYQFKQGGFLSWARQQYDMAYGFYVVMGGLEVDVSDLHDDYSRLTITPAGVLCLAKKGIFLDTPRETIKDKSKADVFAKVLVCLQVCWVIVLMSARLLRGLPLSLLEGHTLVHVFTALGMYTLWFKKPLDVSEASLINIDDKRGDIALMLMRNEGFGRKAISTYKPDGPRIRLGTNWDETSESAYLKNYLSDPREVRIRYANNLLRKDHPTDPEGPRELRMVERLIDPPTGKAVSVRSSSPASSQSYPRAYEYGSSTLYPPHSGSNPFRRTSETSSTASNARLLAGSTMLELVKYYDTSMREPIFEIPCDTTRSEGSIMSGQALPGGIGPLETVSPAPTRSEQFTRLSKNNPNYSKRIDPETMGVESWKVLRIDLSVKDQVRWEAAASVLQKDGAQLGLDKPVCYFINEKCSNLPVPGQKGMAGGDKGWIALIFIVLCTAYGGIHLVAWNYEFATKVEQMLWRASCIDLVAAGLGYALLYTFYLGLDEFRMGSSRQRSQHLQLRSTADWCLGAIAGSHFIIYTMARAFIVVEAFISLRHLPIHVFETVSWVAFIPHF